MADNMAVRSDLGDGVLDQLEEAARIVLVSLIFPVLAIA